MILSPRPLPRSPSSSSSSLFFFFLSLSLSLTVTHTRAPQGVADALKKKYAKTITFYVADPVLSPEDEETVLEEYVFKVRYGARNGEVALDDITVRRGGVGDGKENVSGIDGDNLNNNNVIVASTDAEKRATTTVTATRHARSSRRLDDEDYIRSAAQQMIRHLCSLMHNLEPMPTDRRFSMKLTYTDDTVRGRKKNKKNGDAQLAHPTNSTPRWAFVLFCVLFI